MPKKITALQVLSWMDKLDREAKAPSMNPNYISLTKFSERNANDIEKAIERFARLCGFHAERTKTQGRKLDAVWKNTGLGRVQVQKERFITSTARKGSSDMKLLIPVIGFVACEIKFGKDTQKKDQKQYEQDILRSGGIYLIVKTFEEFLIWYVERKGRPPLMQQAIDKLTTIGNNK